MVIVKKAEKQARDDPERPISGKWSIMIAGASVSKPVERSNRVRPASYILSRIHLNVFTMDTRAVSVPI